MNPTTRPRAGRREWIGVAALALPCMLVVMDLSVLFLAVPSLTEDLRPSSTELLWITDVYGFLIAGALIAMGALGDRVGRRAGEADAADLDHGQQRAHAEHGATGQPGNPLVHERQIASFARERQQLMTSVTGDRRHRPLASERRSRKVSRRHVGHRGDLS